MPPAPLVLVSAAWEEGNWVRLVFDRAIDVAGLDGSQVVVADGDSLMQRFAGTGAAVLFTPNGVQVELAAIGSWSEPGVVLDATAATGIVAAAPPVGGTWAGAIGLPLPWP